MSLTWMQHKLASELVRLEITDTLTVAANKVSATQIDNKYKIYSKVSGVKHQRNEKTVSISQNYSGLNVIALPQHWQFHVLP